MNLLRRLFGRPAPLELVLYTRAGCHLCEAMKAEIARAPSAASLPLREVDIDLDPGLRARFDRSIPVLEIAGRPAFKGRLAAADLERKLARRERARPDSRPGPNPRPGERA